MPWPCLSLLPHIYLPETDGQPILCFGTGKVGVLGGYTNAILLLIAAGAMAFESIERLINPVHILFNQAIFVAVIGLVVICVSIILGHGAWSQPRSRPLGSQDDDSRAVCYQHSHEDHNLKAAYFHVITDALTSVLAIFALLAAKFFGLAWADPLVGILGAIVVTNGPSVFETDQQCSSGQIRHIRDGRPAAEIDRIRHHIH